MTAPAQRPAAAADPFRAGRARILRRSAEALRPDPLMTISEWGSGYRVFPQGSPSPGKWRPDKAPYVVEPMNRLSRQDPCQTLVLMWASQLGKTEILLISLGCYIHTSPRPMFYVQPTIETAEEHSKERVQPLIDNTPVLAERMSVAKSRDGSNTLRLKRFPGGFIKFAGANSKASLASTPIGDAFCDEIDRWPENCEGEGDPVALVKARLTNFPNRKLVLTSTPTETDRSRVEKAYNGTDRNRRWVPCPHCGEFQVLHWRTKDGPQKGEYRLQWAKGRPWEAVYICEHNGCVIREHEKHGMDLRGVWRPEAPEQAQNGLVRGYHLSALLSPWFRWAELAAEWEQCHDDPVQLRTFVNTRLAETFDSSIGGSVKAEGLLDRREPYVVAPAGVVVVTGAIDVQVDRLELHLIGWGAGFESWALDYVVLNGSPSGDSVWTAADAHLRRRITTEDGRTLPVAAACVDTGADASFADRAALFCQGREDRRIWPIKGASAPEARIWPKRPSKDKRNKNLALYLVGVGQCKTDIYDRLSRKQAGAGYMHFPERWPTSGHECDAGYFDQLVAEKRVRKMGKWRWTKRREGMRNEVLDLWVYAYAALHGLIRLGLRLPRPSAPTETPPPVPATVATAVTEPPPPPAAQPAPTRQPARTPPARRPPPRPGGRPRSIW